MSKQEISAIISAISALNKIVNPDVKAVLSESLQPVVKKDINALHQYVTKLKSFEYDELTYREIYNFINGLYDIFNKNSRNIMFDYNPESVQKAVEHFEFMKGVDLVSHNVTITTTCCKRLDLLSRTINSFLECVTDYDKYVNEWIVIDDNSSESDRERMQKLYPFITFVFKTPEQKGHAISMNMLLDMVKSEYVFNIEDDWEFFRPDNYIQQMMNVFDENQKFGQVLINVNYSEDTKSACNLWGAKMRSTKDKQRYFIHSFYQGKELEKMNALTSPMFGNCYYWPHYSLRVGLTKKSVFDTVGNYNLDAKHFEMEYAYRYVQAGFLTAFLDGTSCGHIGRRTYERDSDMLNAYDLNDEAQFGQKKTIKGEEHKSQTVQTPPSQPPLNNRDELRPEVIEIDVKLINLKRRRDRLMQFFERNKSEVIPLSIFDACDGKLMKPSHKIQKGFRSGDYNYRSGIIGCAMSHVKIWKSFLKDIKQDYVLVLEDDIQFVPEFQKKFIHLVNTYHKQFEIMFIHYNPYGHSFDPAYFDQQAYPTADLWSVEKSRKCNMGSTAGYIISREGAKNMLRSIEEKGFTNAIDWVMFQTGDSQRIMYSKPMLLHANCCKKDGAIDTDIQTDFSHLSYRSPIDWEIDEITYLRDTLLNSYVNVGCTSVDFVHKYKDDVAQTNGELMNRIKDLSGIDIIRNPKRHCSIVCTKSIEEQQMRDYILMVPVSMMNEVKKVTHLQPVKWYHTSLFIYIIPEKFMNENTAEERVWGDKDFINVLCPF